MGYEVQIPGIVDKRYDLRDQRGVALTVETEVQRGPSLVDLLDSSCHVQKILVQPRLL